MWYPLLILPIFFLLPLNSEKLLNDQLPVASLRVNLAESSLNNVCNSSFFTIAEHPKRFLSLISKSPIINHLKLFVYVLMAITFSSYVSQIILCASAALLFWWRQNKRQWQKSSLFGSLYNHLTYNHFIKVVDLWLVSCMNVNVETNKNWTFLLIKSY